MFNSKDQGVADDSTRVPLSQKSKDLHGRFHNQIIKAEMKELDFMRHKCLNLKDSIGFLKNENSLLKKENSRLLALNSQYLGNVNILYEEKMDKIEKIVFPDNLTGAKSQLETVTRDLVKRSVEGYRKLENDHRKLIKHCAVVQKENSYLKSAFDEFSRWKDALLKVNHTDIYKLAKEIQEIEGQNQQVRQSNNQLNYQVEKLKLDLTKIESLHNQTEKEVSKSKKQISQNRASINKFAQERVQSDNSHQRIIYQLQVKSDQLEKKIRSDQSEVNRILQQSDQHQIEKVEFVYKEQSLVKTMREMASLLFVSNNDSPMLGCKATTISFSDKKQRRPRGSRSLSIAG